MKLETLQALEIALDRHTTMHGTVEMTGFERELLANKYGIDPIEVDAYANTLAQQKGLQVLKNSVRKKLGLVL